MIEKYSDEWWKTDEGKKLCAIEEGHQKTERPRWELVLVALLIIAALII